MNNFYAATILIIISAFILVGCKAEEELVNPCNAIKQFEFSGEVYHTVQIGTQCWMKENLNVGSMINNETDMNDNSIMEKFCYNNNEDSCNKYGGLYQWNEVMQYSKQTGTQGICPPGWHVPSDEEWNVLEGTVDNKYRVGDSIWKFDGYRGYDAGTNLKSTYGWKDNINGTDKYSFTALPAGGYIWGNNLPKTEESGYWWTSSFYHDNDAIAHGIQYNGTGTYRGKNYIFGGLSVRCIKDQD